MSLPAVDSLPAARARVARWIERKPIQKGLIALILINAVILGMETSASLMASALGPVLLGLDKLILSVFVVEISLRLYAYRWRFFRDPWSVFDFLVVGIALIPSSGAFAVLRAFRVLRVLRLLTMIPNMRRVVGGLLAAIPGLLSVVAIIGILFYVAAVIATKLFGASFPEWFGDLAASAYTLFQVMTLESWSMGIVRPVMETYPYAWAFFIPFILTATFTMLNLFIAIIVNAIQSYAESEREEAVKTVEDALHQAENEIETHVEAHLEQRLETRLAAMEEQLRGLRKLLEERRT